MLRVHVTGGVAHDEIARPSGVIAIQTEDRPNDKVIVRSRDAAVDDVGRSVLVNHGGDVVASGSNDASVEVDVDGFRVAQRANGTVAVVDVVGSRER